MCSRESTARQRHLPLHLPFRRILENVSFDDARRDVDGLQSDERGVQLGFKFARLVAGDLLDLDPKGFTTIRNDLPESREQTAEFCIFFSK